MNERLLSSQNASCSRPVSKALSSHMNVYKPVVRRRSVHVNSKERDIVVPAASIELQAPTQPSINCHTLVDDSLAVDIDEGKIITRFVAETLLPTKHGRFRLRGYKHSADGGLTFTEPAAIICGQVENGEDVPVRVHDACFTSEVLGSLKCDCAQQLSLALEKIHKSQYGIVIYLQQEGRGIGLANKIAAYSLQERGLDTVDANRALGLPDDCREYTSVRNILKELGVKSIQLITNNPRKINQLRMLGLSITGRIPCIVQEANEHNMGYLAAKRDRMSHFLSDNEDSPLCFWSHDEHDQLEQTKPATTGKRSRNLKSDKGLVYMNSLPVRGL